MVNVPQAVWIDETGRIVRPPETAGSTDHLRRMDRTTRKMSPEDEAARVAARAAYLDAVRDWVLTGHYELSPDQVRQKLPRVTPEIASANAHFRLGIWVVPERPKRRSSRAACQSQPSPPGLLDDRCPLGCDCGRL
jgi:hypothetical protein